MKLPMKYSYKNVLEWGIFNHTEAHYYLVAVTPSLSNYVSYFCRVLFIVPVFNLIFYYCTVCINVPIIAEMDILNRFMPELIILFSSQLTWAFYKECEGMSCWRGAHGLILVLKWDSLQCPGVRVEEVHQVCDSALSCQSCGSMLLIVVSLSKYCWWNTGNSVILTRRSPHRKHLTWRDVNFSIWAVKVWRIWAVGCWFAVGSAALVSLFLSHNQITLSGVYGFGFRREGCRKSEILKKSMLFPAFWVIASIQKITCFKTFAAYCYVTKNVITTSIITTGFQQLDNCFWWVPL